MLPRMMYNNVIRKLLVAVAVSIWHVSILLLPGGMLAMGAETDDSESAKRVQLSSITNSQQVFQSGKAAKLVYHFPSDEYGRKELAITYVTQGKLGKRCTYGYVFTDMDDQTLICGFFVACKKSKDNHIVYTIFRDNSLPIEVRTLDYKLINNNIYTKIVDDFGQGKYIVPWECLSLNINQIEELSQFVAIIEKNEEEMKKMNQFARFISKAFNDRGEVGVKSAINKSKRYAFSDDSE